MKRIFFSVLVLILFVLAVLIVIFEKPEEPVVIEDKPVVTKSTSLMEFGKYKDIKVENIDYIEKIRYTEGGASSRNITTRSEIESTYNYLDTRIVGSRTEMACEDNTTVYKFYMKDDTSVSIEIECGVLVMGKNRYVLK